MDSKKEKGKGKKTPFWTEELHQQLLEAVGEAVIATDLEGNVFYWNRAAEELYGWSSEEAVGKNVVELIPSAASKKQAREIMSALQSGESWRGEFEVQRRDGSSFTALVADSPIYDENEKLVGIIGISSDVSAFNITGQKLGKRVKELQTLYSSIELLQRPGLDFRKRLQMLVEEIPSGWMYPEITEVKLSIEGTEFKTSGFSARPWRLSSDIVVDKRIIGELEVELSEEREILDEGPFLKEERELQDSLAGKIAEVWQMEETKRLQERVFSNLTEAVLIMREEEGERIIQDINSAGERMLGYSAAELIGKSPRILQSTSEEARHFQRVHLPELGREETLSIALPLRRKDGSIFQAEVRAALLDSARGLEGGSVEVITDITERLEARKALEESERRFRAFVEQGEDLTSALTERGNVIYASPAFERYLGYDREELIGKNVFDFIHPDEQTEAREVWAKVGAKPSHTISDFRMRFRHKDGSWRIWETTLTNLLDDPAVGAILTNGRDVTTRVEMEETMRSSQRMESIGRLAGGIAHDFNNLLTVIRGQTNLLLEDLSEDDPTTEELELIRTAAERAAKLTSQLLAFSREQTLRPQIVEMGEMVDEMSGLIGRVIGEKITVEIEANEKVPPVKLDRSQLEQVVINLAVNARDAMPEGGTLTFETSVATMREAEAKLADIRTGPYSVLTVTDTGTGIEPKVLEKIFEPFFTTKGKEGGTGLGLAMAYGFAKQSGGCIEVQSKIGKGTSFIIKFPAVRERARKVERSTVEAPRRRERLEEGRVLVIEDNEGVQQVAAKVLRRVGLDVRLAGSGEDGLELLVTGEKVDLLLTDLGLPGMSGRDVVSEVRKLYPTLPIVVMSGYDAESEEHRKDIPDEIPFVQKPFTPGQLVAILREALK